MPQKLARISVAALLLACCVTHAADSLATYRERTSGSLKLCRIVVSTALFRMKQGDSAAEALNNGNGTDGDGNWPKCIADQKRDALTLFQAASKSTRKPAAREALKAYHVIFATALDGVVPANDELRIDYVRRQNLADTRLSEAWNRVDLELLPP